MKDHTYMGVPVSQMRTVDIHESLRGQIVIIDSEGWSNRDAIEGIIERLKIELLIREKNLRP